MIFPIVNDHDSRNPKADQIFSSAPDAERFAEVIDLLAPHIDETVLVTGGFAVEWNLLAKGGGANRRVLNDIDLAVDRRSAILPSITNHFLVHHFHPTREKGNVLMQLVEPKSKTRVHIFSARAAGLADRGSRATVGNVECLIVSAEDLSARLLAIAAVILEGNPVDAKYFDSLNRLMAIVDEGIASKLWSGYRWGSFTKDFRSTVEKVTKVVAERSDLLKSAAYSQDIIADCTWCISSKEFPIAHPREVYRLLGYV